jgi:hypothetical protein
MERKNHPGSHNLRGRPAPIALDDLVLALLNHLATDYHQLTRFLDLSGLSPQGLRDGLAAGTLQAGLLDHLLHHEDLIEAVATALHSSPEDVVTAIDVARRGPARFISSKPESGEF